MTITRLAQFSAETRITTDLGYGRADVVAPVISTTKTKTGTYSYRLATNTSTFGKAFGAGQSAIRMGYWFNHVGPETSPFPILYEAGNGTNQFSSQKIIVRWIPADNTLSVIRPVGTSSYETLISVAIPDVLLTQDVWVHIGITHKLHETDGFLSLYVNGVRVIALTGDTRTAAFVSGAQAFSTSLAYALGPGEGQGSVNGWAANAYADDLFIDSYVDELDAPVPARRFLFALPNGAGANAEWTPIGSATNYENVDENPHTSDTDYNKALAADLKDTFAFGDVTVPVDHRIVAVVPVAAVKRLDSEVQNQIRFHAYDGIQYAHGADLDLPMDYNNFAFHRFTVQPDGSVWDETDFNAMQFGYESRGIF